MTNEPISAQDYIIHGVGRLNVLMGKNGSGKSTVLKRIHQYVKNSPNARWADSSYITPERSGVLLYDAHVENSIIQNVGYLGDSRLVNQFQQFKQQTMAQYRQLEVSVSRRFQAAHRAGEPLPAYFSDYVESINSLLDNVEIREEGSSFKIYDRESSIEIQPGQISSGESELIALAIESLVFGLSLNGRSGVLLLDEPDVHLHPDLQARLIRFIFDLVDDLDFDVIIATHSTPVLAEIASRGDTSICLMRAREKVLTFEPTDSIYQLLLPVFGAHPLSEIFNRTRTLLVEGDDDERVWREAVRASGGGLKLMPVGCEGTSDMSTYEKRMNQIVSVVYEDGRAYSLRDGDGMAEQLDDLDRVVRARMNCYSAENLLLSDDVLASINLSWAEVTERIKAWCSSDLNHGHEKISAMKDFVDSGFDRKNRKIKDIRMLLLGQILESNKPWEVLVGKVIGKLHVNSPTGPDSLRSYLSAKVVSEVLGIS